MKCPKCGEMISDGAVFCTFCGEKLTANATVKAEMGGNTENKENISQAAAPLGLENDSHGGKNEENTDAGGNVSKKKSHKALIMGGICVSTVVILAVLAICLWRTVFFAVSPEKYTAMLIRNTLSETVEELDEVEENIFGMDLTMDDDFTVSVDSGYKDSSNEVKVSGAVVNKTESDELLLNLDIENNGKKNTVQGFIGDENVGLSLPGTGGKYLVVPSKKAGKELVDGNGYLSSQLKEGMSSEKRAALSTLDISYSNIKEIISGDSENGEIVEEILKENLIVLLENCDLEGRKSTKYSFNDDTVNAKKITGVLQSDNLFDFVIDTITDIQKNETLRKKYSKDTMDTLEEMADAVEEIKDDTYIDDIELELIEYKGKIVSFKYAYESDDNDYYDEYKVNYTVTVSMTDKKHILNGIKRVESIEDEGTLNNSSSQDKTHGKYKYEIGFEANFADEDEKIFANAYAKNSGNYKSEYTYDDSEPETYEHKYNNEKNAALELNFDKGKWKFGVTSKHKWDDEEKTKDEYEISGKCSKDDGFMFEIDEKFKNKQYSSYNSMTYDEWLEGKFSAYSYEYLYDIYNDKFYYSYDSYYDWRNSASYDIWNHADSDFEEWLLNELGCSSLNDEYESDTKVEETNTENIRVYLKLNMSDVANLNIKKGKYDNILKWSKSDFDKFAEDFKGAVK